MVHGASIVFIEPVPGPLIRSFLDISCNVPLIEHALEKHISSSGVRLGLKGKYKNYDLGYHLQIKKQN